jgi:hypothetical protein
MEQRGRSPSTGQRNGHIRNTPSPSPHGYNNISHYDPSLHPTSNFPVTSSGFDSTQFLATTQSQQFQQQAVLDQNFMQASQGLSQHNTPHFGPQGSNLQPDSLDIANNGNPDFNSFFAGADLNQNQPINPTYLGATLDPQLLDSQPQHNQQSINPSDLMSQMATTQAHSPTPPHLMPTMNNQQTPSPHASPNMAQGAFPSPGHSRHASLDPSAAYGPSQCSEWGNMANFRGHRRAPSETYSDVSSAHASPYLTQQDSFEENQPSPLLNAQADPQLFHDPVMQFGQFTLNDGSSHISPGHSPHLSPRLIPQQQQHQQQSLPQFQPGSFGLEQGMNNQYGQQGMGVYNQGPEPFPSLNQGIPEFGQADAMSPPEINIDFAPPSRQASFEPPKPEHQADALSPPDRCKYYAICARSPLIMLQRGAATEYAPSLIRSAVLARVLLHQVQKCIDPCLLAPPSLVLPLLPASPPVVRRLAVYPIVTTSSTSQIPAGPRQQTAQTPSAHKSTLQRFSVICVRNVSRAPTIFGRICAPIQTSARSCVAFAAKHSPASMTASAMKAYTPERRSLFAAEI